MIPSWMDLTVNKYLSAHHKDSSELLHDSLESKDKRKDILRNNVLEDQYRRAIDQIAGRQSQAENDVDRTQISKIEWITDNHFYRFDNFESRTESQLSAYYYTNDTISNPDYRLYRTNQGNDIHMVISFPDSSTTSRINFGYNIKRITATKSFNEKPKIKFRRKCIKDDKFGISYSDDIALRCTVHQDEIVPYPWSKCPKCSLYETDPIHDNLIRATFDIQRKIQNDEADPHAGILRVKYGVPWITDEEILDSKRKFDISYISGDSVFIREINPEYVSSDNVERYRQYDVKNHRAPIQWEKMKFLPWSLEDDVGIGDQVNDDSIIWNSYIV